MEMMNTVGMVLLGIVTAAVTIMKCWGIREGIIVQTERAYWFAYTKAETKQDDRFYVTARNEAEAKKKATEVYDRLLEIGMISSPQFAPVPPKNKKN